MNCEGENACDGQAKSDDGVADEITQPHEYEGEI